MAKLIEKKVNKSFEQTYYRVRKQEGRILTSDQIKTLPRLKNDPNSDEWEYRWKSTDRLINYIGKLKPKTVLDLGCGNGWLCYKLATMVDDVIGVDINKVELDQANEILMDFDNVRLLYSNVMEDEIDISIDIIIINASIQYFPNARNLIERLSSNLKHNGEIHIVDSPFYLDDEVEKAKNRSSKYYESLNEEGMSDYYFHHKWTDLNGLSYSLLYDPRKLSLKLKQRVGFKDSPFPWIKITF